MDTETRHRLLDLDVQIRKNKQTLDQYKIAEQNRRARRQRIGWYW